jgi:hypothetical protein
VAEDGDVTAFDARDPIESLIADVRRALWLGELQRATRVALWAWAAIMTLAAMLHALIGRPGLATALALGGIAGCIALAATAARRPGDAAAALHADRRLGGQSAYSTWLEARGRESARLDTPAGQRLLEWTAAAVPASRIALSSQRTSWRLLRPAAAAAICTALAITITLLGTARPGPSPVPGEQAGRRPAPAETLRLDEAALADTLVTELTAPGGRVEATSDRNDREPSADGGSAAAAPGDAAIPDGEEASTLRPEAAGVTAAPGSGREAGSTRDDSAPDASSRATAGPMLVQRRDVSGSADDSQHRADDERVASYLDESADGGRAAAGVEAGAAAARPPAARREARLTPAEAAYVARWQADARTANQEQR